MVLYPPPSLEEGILYPPPYLEEDEVRLCGDGKQPAEGRHLLRHASPLTEERGDLKMGRRSAVQSQAAALTTTLSHECACASASRTPCRHNDETRRKTALSARTHLRRHDLVCVRQGSLSSDVRSNVDVVGLLDSHESTRYDRLHYYYYFGGRGAMQGAIVLEGPASRTGSPLPSQTHQHNSVLT
jgi:hypothetical protein